MKNIVVIQTSFLGDCILSLPFLSTLLSQEPKAQIHILTTGAGLAVFKMFKEKNNLDNVLIHHFDKKKNHRNFFQMKRWTTKLKATYGSFNTVYCIQRSFRTGLLALLLGAQERIGFASGASSFFYTHRVSREWTNSRLEIEKNRDLLRIKYKIKDWDLELSPSLLIVQASPKKSRIVASFSSPWGTKMWPEDKAIEFCQQACQKGFEVVLVGDQKAQQGICRAIVSNCSSLLLKDLSGKTSIPQLTEVISQASVVLSGDSAAIHIASDANVPVIALFGPTTPAFGFAPWRKGSKVLQVEGLKCRPCHIHGPKICPLKHHNCMNNISVDSVLREVESYVN